MANQISRAEAWEVVHEAFTQINFNSFDFNTIKESLLDYVKLYFPEDFNDYIESSEFIAILEIFAYVGELLAYRLDLNAHENFITTAERKESILRLAKLISYKSSRNIPARGLVKISSIQTTELIVDSQGRNLANQKIIWNDLNNVNWKEQFLLVMNRVLSQDFGSVEPSERVQIEDVLFELYSWDNLPLKSNGITTFNYSSTSAGQTFPMELVPVQLSKDSPLEKRPERDAQFTLLYGSDGLGDSSDTTGFFCFTKQGTLEIREETFDGVTPNQTTEIKVNNINETDIWLNNVDPNTREVITLDPFVAILPHLVDGASRYGEWFDVDLSSGQNIIFNTDSNRQKYEVETLDDDRIKLIFGDGEFSDIPSGSFDLWYRISANSDTTIQQTSVVDTLSSFTYLDSTNVVQTFTFTYTLINSLQNSSPSEDIEHIRRNAPSVYYTQDRMVNGRDYNSFMLKDPSILKLRSVNRTFAGDSKYISWHDPKEYYEDVKIFSEDLALYWTQNDPINGGSVIDTSASNPDALIRNYIEPLLCSSDFYNIMIPLFVAASQPISTIRCKFTTIEFDNIEAALQTAATSSSPVVDLYFLAGSGGGTWTVGDNGILSVFMIRIEAQFNASVLSTWSVNWSDKRMTAQSQSTKFRHTNTTDSVIDFNTLNSNNDTIIVLAANVDGSGDKILQTNKNYSVLAQELVEQNLPNAGLPDIHKLNVISSDTDNDGTPNFEGQVDILQATEIFLTPASVDVVFDYITIPGMDYMTGTAGESLTVFVGTAEWPEGTTGNTYKERIDGGDNGGIRVSIELNTNPAGADVTVFAKQFVYFTRGAITDSWLPVLGTDINKNAWFSDRTSFKREEGRYPLNFAWFYTTPRLHLVDPAASNIIDTFIITRSYYQGLQRWLENKTNIKPTTPTPLDLRTAYFNLLENRMISDTVILQSGVIKILFGEKAIPELQAKFKVIRPSFGSLTDNEVKVKIVETIRKFFDINDWDFGGTFYFTELAASIHNNLSTEINSVVLVPTFNTNQFGDLFEVQSRENELFAADVTTANIEIINSFTPENIRQ